MHSTNIIDVVLDLNQNDMYFKCADYEVFEGNLHSFIKRGVKELAINNLRVRIVCTENSNFLLIEKICARIKLKLSVHTHIEFFFMATSFSVADNLIMLCKRFYGYPCITIDPGNNLNNFNNDDLCDMHAIKVCVDKLNNAAGRKIINKPLIRWIINPKISAELVFNYLVDILHIRLIDIELPLYDHSRPPPEDLGNYSHFLTKFFSCWLLKANLNINVFCFSELLFKMRDTPNAMNCHDSIKPLRIQISRDGMVSMGVRVIKTGGLISVNEKIFNIEETSLKKIANFYGEAQISIENSNYPNGCCGCCWLPICGGGEWIHGYTTEGKYNEKSIFCQALSAFYTDVLKMLGVMGVDLPFCNGLS